MKDIFDIVPPYDLWSTYYAHLAYLHTGLKMTFATKIPVVTKIEVSYE